MARFMGSVKGGHGIATRLGHETTGLHTTANGWNGGVDVRLYVNEGGYDCARITLTGGSHGADGAVVIIYDGPLNATARLLYANTIKKLAA